MKTTLMIVKFSLFLAFSLWLNVHVIAATIYKTVDSAGKVSYSDIAPALDPQQLEMPTIEKITLPDYSDSPITSGQQLKQISEAADKLKQDRLDRESLELKKQQLKQQATYQPPIIVEENHYYPYRRPINRYRDFPKIHKRPKPPVDHTEPRERDSRKLLIPRSKLLTP